ncbi:MAG: winged helix-turn-helix domain-containing protein [Deinococcota bacterium]|jgi:transposase|nr:winged helix-turn-helix domain-containing protein [Deinococcota bacterium]
MSKLIPLKLQHSVEELRGCYRASSDAVERRRLQVIWFLAEGKSRSEIVKLTAYNRISICEVVKRYNSEGLPGLRDRRHENPGCPPLLSEEERAQLLRAMQQSTEEQGVWSAARIQSWIKENLAKEVYLQRAYELLDTLGFSLQSPRPQHSKADLARQDEFKKRPFQPE